MWFVRARIPLHNFLFIYLFNVTFFPFCLSGCISMTKITTLSHLFRWNNLDNRWLSSTLLGKRMIVLHSDPNSFFQWRQSSHLILTLRPQSLEKKWRGTQSMLLEFQDKVSTVSNNLESHNIWCGCSSGSSEVYIQPSHLPQCFRVATSRFFSSDMLYRDVDFILQQNFLVVHII